MIAFGSQWPDYRYMHTWTLSLTAADPQERARPFLQHSYEEGSASFSPAERGEAPRWIAYTSNETGRDEVYVRDFPAGSRKWQVSNHGGRLPLWRRDGRELFYLTPDGTLTAVPVTLSATFEFDTPQALFGTGLRPTLPDVWFNQYAAARDGQRFLLNRQVADTTSTAITAVIPW